MNREFKFVGVDVGGPRKGFHLVGLSEGNSIISQRASTPDECANTIKGWCGQVIAIDAPMAWAAEGPSRKAERELERCGIHCFKTPTEEVACGNPFYDWVRNGLALYDVLRVHGYKTPEQVAHEKRSCLTVMETFPHAIAKRLSLLEATPLTKSRFRRNVLRERGIDEAQLANIDFVDAALCALLAKIYAEHGPQAVCCLGGLVEGMFIPQVPNPVPSR